MGKLVHGPWRKKRRVKNARLPLAPLNQEYGAAVVEFPDRVARECERILKGGCGGH